MQTIVAHEPDSRQILYDKALKAADINALTAQKLTYRMRLIQNELIVDARKDSAKPQGGEKAQKQKAEQHGGSDNQQAEQGQQEEETNAVKND